MLRASLGRLSLRACGGVRRLCSSAEAYDVVVIGGGPGGYPAAIKAGQMGLRVACIEKRGRLGGTCLNVGCIPSKALLHSSHLYEEAAHGWGPHGISADNVKMDLSKLMAHKDKTVIGLTSGIEGLFKKYKVDYFKGTGEILAAGEVKCSPIEGGEVSTLKTKNIVIATGSEPASLPNVPIDEKSIVSSTGALDLKEVPKKLIVVGAGGIGLEMGSIFKKQKMKFKMSTKVMQASVKPEGGVVLKTEPVKGGDVEEMHADIVLVSTGRVPYTEGLGLENVGVKVGARGMIEVDDHFATNVPGIWAIGDCVRGAMLAHKAEEEGIAIIEQA
ncbi:MAG: hypothetical protein SGPRY_004226 [Prymnesium sp.]